MNALLCCSLLYIAPPLAHAPVKSPEMDAAAQKIVRDTVAALQSNDPALKKLDISELGACSRARAAVVCREWVVGGHAVM